MSRKKATKKAKLKKATAKTGTKIGGSNLTRALEKSFTSSSAKLIAQCTKELNTYRAQEKKLTAALNKATAQQDTAETKLATLTAKAETKPGKNTKKQLTVAKKTLGTTTTTIAGVTKQLQQLNQITTTLGLKQGAYATLQKQLATFDKQWDVKHKTPEVTAKKAKKKTKKSTASNTNTSTYETTTPNQSDRTIVSDSEIETIE